MGVRWREIFPSARLFALCKTILLVSLGLALSGGRFNLRTAGFVLIATVLWALLYALNEMTDHSLENDRHASCLHWGAISLGILALLGCSLQMPDTAGSLLRCMIVMQLIYSVPPLRLKRFWWFPLVASGLVNPMLRVYYGASLGTHLVPTLLIVLIAAANLAGSIVTREFRRQRDRDLGYQSMPEGIAVPIIGGLATLAAVVAGLGLVATGLLPRSFIVWGCAALSFGLWYWCYERFSKRADAVVKVLMAIAFLPSLWIVGRWDKRRIRDQWLVLAIAMIAMGLCLWLKI